MKRNIDFFTFWQIGNEMKILKDDKREKTAANERFGASGAVTRLKVCANLEVLRPFERLWKPRLREAAWTLCESGRKRGSERHN